MGECQLQPGVGKAFDRAVGSLLRLTHRGHHRPDIGSLAQIASLSDDQRVKIVEKALIQGVQLKLKGVCERHNFFVLILELA